MSTTEKLMVYGNASQQENEIKINPNDGLDIELTHTKYFLKITIQIPSEKDDGYTEDYIDSCIFLDNKCKSGTAELSMRLWKKIGKPAYVKLTNKDESWFLENQ